MIENSQVYKMEYMVVFLINSLQIGLKFAENDDNLHQMAPR